MLLLATLSISAKSIEGDLSPFEKEKTSWEAEKKQMAKEKKQFEAETKRKAKSDAIKLAIFKKLAPKFTKMGLGFLKFILPKKSADMLRLVETFIEENKDQLKTFAKDGERMILLQKKLMNPKIKGPEKIKYSKELLTKMVATIEKTTTIADDFINMLKYFNDEILTVLIGKKKSQELRDFLLAMDFNMEFINYLTKQIDLSTIVEEYKYEYKPALTPKELKEKKAKKISEIEEIEEIKYKVPTTAKEKEKLKEILREKTKKKIQEGDLGIPKAPPLPL